MATTTPNYLWSVPTSSDLVKNGATAIETLGDSVDASLWNSGYGQAGKNKIINGDFSVNQRNFSSSTTSADYNFDRWRTIYTGGTSTTSAQVFTPGAAPVAGYEGKNYYRVVVAGQSAVTDFSRIQEVVESVRTFAGQTTTYSFWAKASAGTPKVAVFGVQYFGTAGSPSATVTADYGTVTLSTSWARYSVTCAIPSISGKTLGTSNDDQVSIRLMLSGGSSVANSQSIGIQNYTFETWGHQWEYGSYATPFQLAGGGSQQSELAMCQRYYYRLTATYMAWGTNYSTTVCRGAVFFPVEMRTAPTALEQTGTATDYRVSQAGIGATVCSAVPSFSGTSTRFATVNASVASGLTQFNPAYIESNAGTPYLGWSAEL